MNRIACVVFLFLAVSAVAAQRDVTTVEVVQVPVYVAARGQAVQGLTRDDFQLFVNGKPQPIDYFDAVDFAGPAVAPQQRRLYLLVFDLVFSTPASILRAQEAAAKYVEAAPENDLFAVASYTSHHGVHFAVPFMRDRVAIRRAISRLRDSGGDPLQLAMTMNERSAIAGARGLFDGGFAARSGAEWMTDSMTAPFRRIVEDQIDNLADVATRLAPLEGQKHVVLLSNGFDGLPVTGGFSSDRFNRLSLNVDAPRPAVVGYGDLGVTLSLREMHARFNAAGVVLDAVAIAGLGGPYDRLSNDALYALAVDTGGSVSDNTNDLRAAIQRLADRQRVVYLLGFRPPDTGRENNSISVKVRRAPSGSRVTYRQAYTTTMPKVSVSDGLRLADIVQNDIPQTGVSVSAKVTAGARRATVTVDVPKQELAALGGNDGDALIYIYSGTAAVAFEQKSIAVDQSSLTQTFELPPGRYTAKVLVRWDGSLGYARTDFTVE